MRYVVLNSYAGYGSTGRLAEEACKRLEQEGHTAVLCHGRKKVNCEGIKTYRIDSPIEVAIHGIIARVFDNQGLNSRFATYRFLKWMDEYKPDVILMNNIHGYYLNYPMLFNYIKKNNIKVEWTLHDCWAMTGHCAHFMAVKCDKWKTQCHNCPEKRAYPTSYVFDNSRSNYCKKKESFTGVENLKLVVPSSWLGNLVKESYLREYPVDVKRNKIDKTVFKPGSSSFRTKNGLEGKIVLLAVSSDWRPRKGIYDLLNLSSILDDRFAIVVLGLTEKQIANYEKEKKDYQLENIPNINDCVHFEYTSGVAIEQNIESIYAVLMKRFGKKNCAGKSSLVLLPKTSSKEELAEAYNAADCFINPTYEDNYPTVNLEAKACGVYIITYDAGGCIETLEAE